MINLNFNLFKVVENYKQYYRKKIQTKLTNGNSFSNLTQILLNIKSNRAKLILFNSTLISIIIRKDLN